MKEMLVMLFQNEKFGIFPSISISQMSVFMEIHYIRAVGVPVEGSV